MPSTFGIIASGEDVLNDAVFWVDAGRSSVSGGALTNLGTGGSALNAVFGNTTGVDTFDPTLLAHTGTNYMYLPGVNGNYASAPNAAPLNITGDIEISCRVNLANWISATENLLVARYVTTGNQRSYSLRISTGGTPYFAWSPDGTTVVTAVPSGGPTFTNGTTYWLKATLDVDNGAAGWTARYYFAADSITEPTLWTQWGTSVTAPGVTSLFASVSAPLEIGAFNNGSAGNASGGIYQTIVRNGIGGTTVFDANFTTGITSGSQTTFTESSANAATVTINRATSGRKSVAVVRPVLLFGTDDYLEVADNDLLDFGASDSFTVVAVVRQWATPTSFGRTISKSPASGAGWQMLNNSTNTQRYLAMSDGTVTLNAGVLNPYSAGSLAITTAVRNVVADTVTLWNATTAQSPVTDTTTASLANGNVMRIGQASTGGSTSDMELVAAAVWRRALNANEIATIVNRYT